MHKNEFEINQIFTQESELPEIVQRKKQEALDRIQESLNQRETLSDTKIYTYNRAVDEAPGSRSRRMTAVHTPARHIPKAAAIVLACLLVTGSTALAAVGLMTRRDRLKAMDQAEIDEIYNASQLSGALCYLSSRDWTESEFQRYKELLAAYRKNERLPDSALTLLQNVEDYAGTGVSIVVTEFGEENILCLPDAEMTDEELLEIIEYDNKELYARYAHRDAELMEKDNWESRLIAMTDEEIDHYFQVAQSAMPVWGVYRRGEHEGLASLIGTESARFDTLKKAYENENLFPEGEMPIIEYPEDYDDAGAAYCKHDSCFHLPSRRELTDEEILEIIDLEKKTFYALQRINEEIETGYREGFPAVQRKDDPVPEVAAKPFADTFGKGVQQTIEAAQIGDIVTFGSYEQDDDRTNGQEPISWYVLDKEDDTMTLLSVKILDQGSYSSGSSYVAWKNCDLRKWLNSDFYNTAFTSEEQAQLQKAVTEQDPDDPAHPVEDYVYLLSYEELMGYFGIRPEQIVDSATIQTTEEGEFKNLNYYHTLDPRIFTEATTAAREAGLWYWTEQTTANFLLFDEKLDFTPANGKSGWWLRTASELRYPWAHLITVQGDVSAQDVVNHVEGIRPMIQIYQ